MSVPYVVSVLYFFIATMTTSYFWRCEMHDRAFEDDWTALLVCIVGGLLWPFSLFIEIRALLGDRDR